MHTKNSASYLLPNKSCSTNTTAGILRPVLCYMLTCTQEHSHLHIVNQITDSRSLKPVCCGVFECFCISCHIMKFQAVLNLAGSQSIRNPVGVPVELKHKCQLTVARQPEGNNDKTATHRDVARARTIPSRVCSTRPRFRRSQRHLSIIVRGSLRQRLRASMSHRTR